jgi:hypothetical protein
MSKRIVSAQQVRTLTAKEVVDRPIAEGQLVSGVAVVAPGQFVQAAKKPHAGKLIRAKADADADSAHHHSSDADNSSDADSPHAAAALVESTVTGSVRFVMASMDEQDGSGGSSTTTASSDDDDDDYPLGLPPEALFGGGAVLLGGAIIAIASGGSSSPTPTPPPPPPPPPNSPPVVNATQAVTILEDSGAKAVTVSATDANNDTLTYSVPATGTGAPTKGAVTGGTGGAFTYTPTLNANGTDSFTVTVNDGKGGTATQTVTVNITAVLDEVVSIDLVGGATVQNENAGGVGFTLGDRFKYTDDSAKATNAVITNFTQGDTIEVTGLSSSYNFTSGPAGALDDLIITFNNTAAGASNVITLKNVGASKGFIQDEVTAELVLGFDFFKALASPPTAGDGKAIQNGNLDDDDDANVLTFAVTDAAGSNVAFTEDANIANSALIKNFAAGDTIALSNVAAITTYSATARGDDIVISYLNGTLKSEIVLAGSAKGVTSIIDDVGDINTIFGANTIKLGPPPVVDFPGTATNIDVGTTGVAPTVINAGTGSLSLNDTPGIATNVLIQNFTSDDRVKTTAAAGVYTFAVSNDPGNIDHDLIISFNNTATGVNNVIVLDEVLVGKTFGLISDYDAAKAAIGFDFMIFG